MNKPIFYEDSTFRSIVVFSTGLGVAFLLGSLASIGMNNGGGFQFRWSWSILAVIAAGALWNWRFWKLIWAKLEQPEQKGIGKLIFHVSMLALLGFGSFLYPLRFADAANWFSISKGLVTAILFLSITFWFIYKFGRIFVDMDKVEMKSQGQAEPETKS
ncbi:MAG: hypothetical protein ACO1QB_09590 [Verrucomicrobiales bacterium]